jgi:hypothetical protein
VTVTIPSADQRSPIPSDRPPRRVPRSLSVLLVLGAIGAVTVATRDTAPDAEPLPPVIAPEVTPPPAAVGDWLYVGFPGGGTFTAVAVSTDGAVAAGQTALPIGRAFVWTSLPGSGEWHSSEIEHADRAVVRDIAPFDGGFLLAGAVLEPGTGTSVPTVWFGAPGSEFTVLDQSFSNPGRINSVRLLDGDLVVTGQSVGPFTDDLRPGSARFGWVQVRRPARWEIVTPPGMSVLVTEVIAVEGLGWLAVGGTLEGAAMWVSTDHGRGWTELDLADLGVVVTDVIETDDGSLRAITQSWDADDEVTVQLLRAEPGSLEWETEGPPQPLGLGWIASLSGGLVGGPFNSVRELGWEEAGMWALWQFGTDLWQPILPFEGARASSGELFVGSAVAPSVGSGPTIVMEESHSFAGRPVVDVEAIWKVVGPSWGSDRTFIDTGSTLIAHQENFFEDELWVRRDPIVWRRVKSLERFRAGGFVESPDGLLAWGSVGPDGVVVLIGGDGALTLIHTFEQQPVEEVVVVGDDLHVFVDAESRDGLIRFDMSRDPAQGIEVAWLPADLHYHDGYLLGTRANELVVSQDLGLTWTRVGGDIGYVGVVDGQVVAVETGVARQVLVLDLATRRFGYLGGDPVRHRGPPTFWAGGVAFVEGESIHLLSVEDGTWQTLVGDYWHGLPNGLREVIPGPRGFVRSDSDLFRWSGRS